jgi:hypothetical protein
LVSGWIERLLHPKIVSIGIATQKALSQGMKQTRDNQP